MLEDGKNGVEVIVLNRNLAEYRKHRCELVSCGSYQPCRRFLKENVAAKVIMDCRAATAVEFRTRLGFNQRNPIMTNVQSVLTKIMKMFSNEKIIQQQHVLYYIIDLYFLEHRLAIEIDEFNHVDRTDGNEREKEIKEYLKYKFIRIDPDRDNYDEFVELGRMENCIDKSKERLTKQSAKKLAKESLIDDLSKKLSEIKFKEDNSIKSKALE